MTEGESKSLNNHYVEEYYNSQVGALSGTYTEDRWGSSVVRKFEYNQTLRALQKALGDRVYERAIEIGPGDAVWTPLIKTHVRGNLHLIEQSTEMLAQAKEKLKDQPGITFEQSDFQEAVAQEGNGLIIAVRCFEYFEDKKRTLKKMHDLLVPGGILIIVTKNSQMFTSQSAKTKTLHSDQVSKEDMYRLARVSGYSVEAVYPAVLRFKASYKIMRLIFGVLHRVAVWSKGVLVAPFLTTYATESYVYIMKK